MRIGWKENGFAIRAEFIRVQCRLAALPYSHPDREALVARQGELYTTHRNDLVEHLSSSDDIHYEYELGLVNEVEGSVSVLNREGVMARICALTTLSRLLLINPYSVFGQQRERETEQRASFRRILQTRVLQRLHLLHICEYPCEKFLPLLVRYRNHLSGMQELELTNADLSFNSVALLLEGDVQFPSLTRLDVSFNAFGSFPQIAPLPPEHTRIILRRMLNERIFPRLAVLDVAHNFLSEEEVNTLDKANNQRRNPAHLEWEPQDPY